MKRLIVVCLFLLGSAALANRHGESSYDRGRAFHSDRHFVEAAAQFIASYEAGFREDASAYNAACAYARAGKSDAAFEWLDRARDAGFDLENYVDDDSDLRSLHSDPRFASLRSSVLGGRVSKHDREALKAVAKYNALMAERPDKSGNYGDTGRELLRLGRYDEAAKAFLAEAAHAEFRANPLYNAACARAIQGEKQKALELLQRAVEEGFTDARHLDEDDDLDNIRHDPTFAKIHALAEELSAPNYPTDDRQRTPEMQREWLEAMPRIAAAVRKYPQLGVTWFNLGFAGIALGHIAQSAPSFQKAVELGYRKATSMYNVACSYALSGRSDEAFQWLDRAFSSGFESWGIVRTDRDLDSLRNDSRFRRVLETARAHEQHF